MKPHSHARLRFGAAILFFTVTVFLMLGGGEKGAVVLANHPGPLWVKLAASFTLLGGVATACLIVATFIFGRVYCSALCPLGAVQDAIGIVSRNSPTTIPNPRILRYNIAALALVALAGGWPFLFILFDPFSRFGGVVSFANGMVAGWHVVLERAAIGLAPFVALIALVLWKKRIYCSSLCPVGTILGLLSKYGLYRLRMTERCTGCGQCAKNCPIGCVDSGKRIIDYERCVLCLNCVSACKHECIVYSRDDSRSVEAGNDTNVIVDASRRNFLAMGATTVFVALGVGYSLSGPIRRAASAVEDGGGLIFPPGAGNAERFARLCTGCQLCTVNCPTRVIIPAPGGAGPVRLDYTRAGCQFDCVMCSAVCPTGALKRVDVFEKQWLKVGEALITPSHCRVVVEKVECNLCVKACPKGAVFLTRGPDGLRIPDVASYHCIGCGICQAVCPMLPKAITVGPIAGEPIIAFK